MYIVNIYRSGYPGHCSLFSKFNLVTRKFAISCNWGLNDTVIVSLLVSCSLISISAGPCMHKISLGRNCRLSN
jgi:hypothetical protein